MRGFRINLQAVRRTIELELRELFIALMLRRPKAEVDLWPSQIDAANRAIDQADDLVVSLPTNADGTARR